MPLAGVFGPAARTPEVLAGIHAGLTRMAVPNDISGHQIHGDLRCSFAVTAPATVHSSQGVLIAFEGRLFEAESLAHSLGLADPLDLEPAELAFAAYQRWGSDFVLHLDGEFTAVVYDPAQSRLILARDVMGRGSIHYLCRGSDLLFATEPVGLFAFPGTAVQPNWKRLAALATLLPPVGQTGFEGVLFPAAGSFLLAQEGRAARTVRCWFPEQQPQLRLPRTSDYAEALRTAMCRAVKVRIPPDGLVATELSAGYDSSAVTALAAHVLARQNRPLVAYTAVPSHPNDASDIVKYGIADEWPLASTLAAKHSNIEHCAVPTAAAPWLESLDCMTEIFAAPPLFIRNLPWMYAARRMAQEKSISHILNGQNGNLAGSYDGAFALFDMRRRGRWRDLLETARQWHQAGASWRSLLMRAWLPTHQTRTQLRRLFGSSQEEFAAYCLLKPDFLQAIDIAVPQASVLGLPVDGDRSNGAARRFSIMQMVDFGGQYAAERRLFQLHRSDPTADRKLVELCLSFPDEVFCPGGKRRALYREAMRGILPEELLQETGFGVQASDFLQNFGEGMPEWRQVLEAAEQSRATADYLDVPRLRHMLEVFAPSSSNRQKEDTLYNYTVGGALALLRFLQHFGPGHDGAAAGRVLP